jgi:flagellar basal body-associated protein FliL
MPIASTTGWTPRDRRNRESNLMARRDRDEEQEEVKPAGITMGKLLMILIPVMLLSIAASGGITYYLVSNMAPSGAEEEAEELEAIENPDPIYVQVGKILVNVDYQGDIRYIQGDVQLMFHHQESADIATRDMPVIVNELNTLFARQAFGEMRSVEGKEKLRRSSRAAINRVLKFSGESGVQEVYFTSFNLQ